MENLVLLKFSQSKVLLDQLLATGNKQFHEATSDKKWGTGVELSSNNRKSL